MGKKGIEIVGPILRSRLWYTELKTAIFHPTPVIFCLKARAEIHQALQVEFFIGKLSIEN